MLHFFASSHLCKICADTLFHSASAKPKYCVAPGLKSIQKHLFLKQGQFTGSVSEQCLKQRLQRRYRGIRGCTVCCGHVLHYGSREERAVTWQLPPCHMYKSQTWSYSIFYLIKRKVATQTAGGRDGRGQQVNLQLLSVRGCALSDLKPRLTVTKPQRTRLNGGVCHITLSAVLVHVTPLRGSHQCFAKSRNSQNGARLRYLVNQQKMQFRSSGFASLGTRCPFFSVNRITRDKKKPQADKWAKIICYFWAFQYIISFSYKSVSLHLWLRLCLAVGRAMRVWTLRLSSAEKQTDDSSERRLVWWL